MDQNAGIDVSKQYLDYCFGIEQGRLENNEAGWDALVAKLQAGPVGLVVLEATGGYERGVVCALQGAAIAVARMNPRQARDFARPGGGGTVAYNHLQEAGRTG